MKHRLDVELEVTTDLSAIGARARKLHRQIRETIDADEAVFGH